MNKLTLLSIALAAIAITGQPIPAIGASVLIENVTLIDGTDNPPLANASVLVDGNKIILVEQGPIDTGNNTARVDGTGKFLIPGLIDTHIHLDGGRKGMVSEGRRELTMDIEAGLEALHGYLYSGVTSIYDAGNHDKFIFKMRTDERSGKIVSPRIFTTGTVVAYPGGYASGVGSTVVGGMDDIDNLQALLDQDPDMVKFVLDPQGSGANTLKPTYTPEALTKLMQYVEEQGFRTTIHVSSEADARTAIDAGVTALAHVMIRGRINESFARMAAARRIPMSTTMVVFSNIARVANDPSFFDNPLYTATLSEGERERQKTEERQRYIASGMAGMFSLMMPYMKENVATLHNAGAILALGTDRTMGPTVHQELGLIVEAGVSPADAIRIATRNAAEYLGRQRDLGTIERGKLADMVLLNADPTIDIANAMQIASVFKDGQKIDRSKLKIPAND